MAVVMDEGGINGHVMTLVSAAAQLNSSELAELSSKAKANLEEMLDDPNGPFKQDPELAMRAYSTLVKLQQNDLESKRRAMDTVVKMVRLYGDVPTTLPGNEVREEREALPPDESSASNLSFSVL